MNGTPRIPCAQPALPAHDTNSSSSQTAPDKTSLRRSLLAARHALPAPAKQRHDAQIGARLLNWHAGMAPASLGVYWPLRGEPDLRPAYAQLRQRGVRLALPLVQERDAGLVFVEWEPGEAMQTDAMGVAVPEQLRPLAMPPALLVPCVGFNAQRYRLGYGGGYYDRTLAGTPRPFTVGIAYACLAASFASAAHDVALDLIMTELQG